MENTNTSVIPIDDSDTKKSNSKLPSNDKLDKSETLKSKGKETTPKNKQKSQDNSALQPVPMIDTSSESTLKNEHENSVLYSVPIVNNIETDTKKDDKESMVINEQNDQVKQIDYSSVVKSLLLDDIFINLNLIAKIEVGDKLYINDKYINIDTSYVQSVVRWYYGVDRRLTINFVRLVVARSFEFCDSLFNSDSKMLFRLTNDLKNSISGLEKLKQTYFADKLVQAEIDVIIESIRSKIESTLITH